MSVKKEDEMLITLKVDGGSYNRLVAKARGTEGRWASLHISMINLCWAPSMGRSSASRMTGKSRHCASVFDQWAGNDWRRNHHESVARPRATTASSTTCRGSGRESQSA